MFDLRELENDKVELKSCVRICFQLCVMCDQNELFFIFN